MFCIRLALPLQAMKKLLAFILVLLVLGAVVPGCRHAVRYDGRLTAADSLMKDAADSALALLEDLSPGELHSGRDSAYRDLLLTQARYKAYVTATSDSDINRALAWFRAHPADREKLTRAYIYKGAVMEELGHPDSAMFYYKHAEANAAPDDYFNLGYSNLRIAELYQVKNANRDAVIMHMDKSRNCFKILRDTFYLAITTGALGAYYQAIDKDSSRLLLEQAANLAKAINSPDRYFYQSKLSGLYFYKNDFTRAKELAMEIFREGKDECEENQFLYYAAISYIRLGMVDSAEWIKTFIPEPLTLQDSMNHFSLVAELARTKKHWRDYYANREQAEIFHRKIEAMSSDSKLTETEMQCDSNQEISSIKKQSASRWLWAIVILALVIGFAVAITHILIRRRICRIRHELELTERELQDMIAATEEKSLLLETEKDNNKQLLTQMSNRLTQVTKRCQELEMKQNDVLEEAAALVRLRQSVLNSIYNEIMVKIKSEDKKKSTMPLLGLIKELNEEKKLLHVTPKVQFWKDLKSLIDTQYHGLATFVEHTYPSLTVADNHLFWLSCADVSPQIIKLCLNYSSAITVSNYKRRLIKEKIGLDVKFEEFIKLYLDGQLHNDCHTDIMSD